MNQYNAYLKDLFAHSDVFKEGHELNIMLQKKFKITPSNARKVISRACDSGVITSSKPATFGHGQYVYFNPSAGLDLEVIKNATKKNRPPVYHLLRLLESNNGITSYYEALKVTASPLKKEKEKSNSLDEILSLLKSLKIIEVEKDEGITYILLSAVSQNSISLMKEHRNNMAIDCMIIPDIKNWLVKHNFIDNSYVVYRNKTLLSKGAEHNNYVWDAYAYTNTTGYNTHLKSLNERDEKKTLVVLDIVVHRIYMSGDVQGFLRRVQAVLSSAKKERKILPIVVYKDISAHAYKQLQGLGFILLNLGSIYGGNIHPIIKTVKDIKMSISYDPFASSEIVENVDNMLSVIDYSGQRDNLGNIKGDLFESLMYPLVQALHPSHVSIEQGKVLKEKRSDGTSEYYEYDIIVCDFQNQEIVVYEFKGYKSTAEIPLNPYDKSNTVKWFFNNTLNFARKQLQKKYGFPVKGCYITTARFSKDALEALNKLNTHKNVKPETHDVYYDGEKLLELLKEKRQPRIIDVLKKHYLNLE
ncbi:hypothetical protein ABEW59_20755 [Bacillus wiedmannii]|uniref:hypothetical protein n=1 Tax=Bacillus wiedmannii TaxID=1890302 RepID=UPI003D206E2C